MIMINVVSDFTDSPGGRYIKEGPFSGELFRQKILLPKYKEAVETNTELIINLDGCYGYATSFIEEAFGGLARELKDRNILKRIQFVSQDEPGLIALIEKYVANTKI